MEEYVSIDLTKLCNVDADWLEGEEELPRGLQVLRGLPFQIGSEDPDQPRFLGFGRDGYSEQIEIPLKRHARWIIIAHRLMESRIMAGEIPGQVVSTYCFRYVDGEEVQIPIRDRFEISVVPPEWGQRAFLAVPDTQDKLFAWGEGKWEETGGRQTEVRRAWPRWFVLWAWRNPDPERELKSISIDPVEHAFIIAGVTVSRLEEDPFGREHRQPIILSFKDDAIDFTNPPSLEVDRGVATYVYPISQGSFEARKRAGFEGWGMAHQKESSQAYAEIVAQPSATVSVFHEDQEVSKFKWDKVVGEGSEETERVKIAIVDRGKNWVHVNVVDDDTGMPVPCRVHFQSPEGIPYQPHGHHDHLLSDMGTFHIDLGGDVRLGHLTYAYIDGKCQGWLPRGEVMVDVARGFEYKPLREVINIQTGQREVTLRMRRWVDMNEKRWFSGDSHVHFLSTLGASLEAQCEDLNVVNLLQSQWGHLFTNTEDFIGRPVPSQDGRTLVYTSQENRQHMLGHLILMGLKEPVMPWCSDGASEAEIGGTLDVTMSHWADACHKQGGTVVLPHFPSPNGEPPALIATGRVDAVEMLVHGMYNHLEYYRYLNGGYRLPLVGGTDKMTSDVPVGLYRTYVYIPPDEEFNYDNWCKNLRLGRTFLSGGPIINFTINGAQVGDTIKLTGNGGTLEVVAEAESIFPIHCLEIVQEGRVVTDAKDTEGARRLSLQTKLKVDHTTWLAARVGGPDYTQPLNHFDGWSRGIMAHTSPIYVSLGEDWQMYNPQTMQYMLTMLHGGIEYIRNRSRQYPAGSVTHHHVEEDHLAYLERPFLEAVEAVEQRMRREGS